jgi:WD40 repeat protein
VPHTLKAAQVAVLNTLYGPPQQPKTRSWKLRRSTVQAALAFSPDGKQLACGDARGRITLRDAGTGRTLRTLRLPAANAKLRALAFSPRARLLAVTSDGTCLCVWDVLEPQAKHQLELGAPGANSAIALSGDERSIAIAGPRGSLELHSGRAARYLTARGRASCLAFSHDASELVIGSADGRVRAVHSGSGSLVGELACFEAPLSAVALGPDGYALAAAGRDGSLWLRRLPAHMRTVAEPPRAWRVFDWLRRAAALTI